MSLKTRHSDSTQPATRTAYTCPEYEPEPGLKRCRSYLPNGGCAREGHAMCEEWLKAYANAVRASAEAKAGPDRDLFGRPVRKKPPRKKTAKNQAPRRTRETTAVVGPQSPDRNVPVVRNLTDEDVDSFRAVGIEVCIASDEAGEVWIVPEYTTQERRELRIDHAAALTAICAVFPGAKVASFEAVAKTDAENHH